MRKPLTIHISSMWFDDIEAMARERTRVNVKSPTHQPLTPDYEMRGLVGEIGICHHLGKKVLRGDDPGYDFDIDGVTFDVKTTKPGNQYLLVEEGKAKADYFILCTATIEPPLICKYIGFASRKAVLRAKPEAFIQGAPPSHNLHWRETKDMAYFEAMRRTLAVGRNVG